MKSAVTNVELELKRGYTLYSTLAAKNAGTKFGEILKYIFTAFNIRIWLEYILSKMLYRYWFILNILKILLFDLMVNF